MINVKDKVYTALREAFASTVLVSDRFPEEFAPGLSVVYSEIDNSVELFTDGAEQLAHLAYEVDIFSTGESASSAALTVDAALSALGLVRTLCRDANDLPNLRCKVMQYEGIIDVNTEEMHHSNEFH